MNSRLTANESYTPVDSSTIVCLAYEKPNLLVGFTSEASYLYKDVPLDVFEEFKKAESKGKYFAANIKGKYEFERLS